MRLTKIQNLIRLTKIQNFRTFDFWSFFGENFFFEFKFLQTLVYIFKWIIKHIQSLIEKVEWNSVPHCKTTKSKELLFS